MMDEEDTESDADTEAENQIADTIQYQAKDFCIPKDQVFGGREVNEDDFDERGYLIDDEEVDANEPPRPDAFMLYRIIDRWAQPIAPYVHKAEKREEAWAHSEAAQDIAWYATMLPVKTYRQLTTRYEVRHAEAATQAEEEEFAEIELGYTGFVLREIMMIIDTALGYIQQNEADAPHEQLAKLKQRFDRFRPFVEEIATPYGKYPRK